MVCVLFKPRVNLAKKRELLYCCVCCSSLWLNLAKKSLSVSVICLAFYSPRPDKYTVAQGLTGGPRVAEPLYRI
jgi:hypothetical protein